MTDTTQQIKEIRQRTARQIEAIEDFTADAKRRMIEEVRAQATDAERRLFRFDPPESVGLYPHEARAQRSGDSIMLQAIYHEALNRGGNADPSNLPPTAITTAVRIADNFRANNQRARKGFEQYQSLRASQADPLGRIFNLM